MRWQRGNVRTACVNRKTGVMEQDLMDDNVQKSCWGVTTWTVVALGSVLVLAYLLGGFETVAIAAK